jgi:hypothetical protein
MGGHVIGWGPRGTFGGHEAEMRENPEDDIVVFDDVDHLHPPAAPRTDKRIDDTRASELADAVDRFSQTRPAESQATAVRDEVGTLSLNELRIVWTTRVCGTSGPFPPS